MSVLYLETSAALTWLLAEKREGEVREALDASDAVLTSSLTFTEIERALVRAESGGILRAGDGQRVRGLLQRAGAAWTRMAVTGEVLDRAARPFPSEPVRTPDAVHLATALVFTRAFADLRVLSFDRRILENAAALGLG